MSAADPTLEAIQKRQQGVGIESYAQYQTYLEALAWNHRAEDLWGLRASEVQGRHLMNLDIGPRWSSSVSRFARYSPARPNEPSRRGRAPGGSGE